MLELRASFDMFSSQRRLQYASVRVILLGDRENLLPVMNDIFRSVQFSQEYEMHAHIQVSLLLEAPTF